MDCVGSFTLLRDNTKYLCNFFPHCFSCSSLSQKTENELLKKYSHEMVTIVKLETRIWRNKICSYKHSVLRDATTDSRDNGASRVLWNVDMPHTEYTALHFTKQGSSTSTILGCNPHSLMLLCTLSWRLDRTAGWHPPISSGCCLMHGRTPGVNCRQNMACVYRGLPSDLCCFGN